MHRGREALDIRLDPNDAGADTIRDYLKALLRQLWTEEAGFSGKRPFGNGSWQYTVYAALIREGYVYGILDDDGSVDEVDMVMADDLMMQAIEEL